VGFVIFEHVYHSYLVGAPCESHFMNIGFDAKRLFLNFTGLGNYSRFIVSALVDNFSEHRYYLFTPRQKPSPDTASFLNRTNIKTIEPGIAWPIKSLWRSAGFSFSREARQLDVFHGLSGELPHFLPRKVKRVVTVHDLIFLRYPEFYKAIDRVFYKRKLVHACSEADAIVAVSQQTASDLVSMLNVPREKIQVIYQGCHPQFSVAVSVESKEAVRRKYNLPREYFLNVSTIEERKNLLTLVEALALLDPPVRLPLVVVGKKTKYFGAVIVRVKQLKLEAFITFIDNMKFSDLPAVYQSAKVFIYPSVFEGFGIPIVEAIESNIPVVSSTGSCFSEAGGPAAIYVDPTDREALAKAIGEVSTDKATREKMVRDSKAYVGRFQSRKIADEMMALYSRL
jgi:glycosyltransferase involved in cell wall biosynthesis